MAESFASLLAADGLAVASESQDPLVAEVVAGFHAAAAPGGESREPRRPVVILPPPEAEGVRSNGGVGLRVAVGHPDESAIFSVYGERGACAVYNGERWLAISARRMALERGPCAIIGDSNPLSERAVAALHERAVGVSFFATTDPAGRPGLSALVDAAARSSEVAVIALVIANGEALAECAATLRKVTRHVPVLLLGVTDDSDPWRRAWLDSLGVLTVSRLDELATVAAAIAFVDPPAGEVARVIAESSGVWAWLAGRAREVGIAVEGGGPWGRATSPHGVRGHDEVIDEIGRSLGATSIDWVIASVPQPRSFHAAQQAAQSLASLVARNPEVPLFLLAAGDESWHGALRHALPRSAVLRATDDPGVALGHVLAWRNALADRGRPLETTPVDTARVRRALSRMTDAVPMWHPELLAEHCAAMGLRAVRYRRVSYVEDAMIAAAELSYPVQLSVIHRGQDAETMPTRHTAANSEVLLQTCKTLLADAQRATGERADLLVRSTPAMHDTWRVRVERHRTHGTDVTLQRGGARWLGVLPPQPAELVELFPLDDAEAAGALCEAVRALRSLVVAMDELSRVTAEVEQAGSVLAVRWLAVERGGAP